MDVASSIIKQDPGSYIKPVLLSYPGQNQPVQDGETQKEPVQVLERAIKQSVRVSKDISQESYENVKHTILSNIHEQFLDFVVPEEEQSFWISLNSGYI